MWIVRLNNAHIVVVTIYMDYRQNGKLDTELLIAYH